MARPIKEGLDYFPLDTDIIHDIKIRKIMRSNGPQSIAVLLDLLGNIYGDHGYYMKWDDDVRFLVADDVGISEAAVDELISKAIQVNFFDETLFKKYSILTSKGIQSRYQKASKRKAGYCIQKPYNLIVNVDNNPVNAYKNSGSSEVIDAESTRKKRKVKKIKENKNKPQQDTGGGLSKLVDLYQENFGVASSMTIEDIGYEFEDWQKVNADQAFDIIKYAMKIALDNQVHTWSYVVGVLKRWRDSNGTSLDKIKVLNSSHKRTGANQAVEGGSYDGIEY
ncbi:hypothetical protein G8J22_01302 [Lentilactobacillus hilgardii]|uniref:Lin1244/Lin1753 domain-containing protein n=1 Tax=Lentilactobacillus hilgardii TaxID=1588 RepID=UPI00019C6233|nr:Lin1244/Lin1753 domain-containing protein [Lentilactobacillus hilgardii]EEI18911.1 DnaD domain protein [Lentilactobacillus buchneri ATCC 11577]QIR09323.1 hypothetical protein G8J22_01302 [Lentilactobacillus hilgardii]